MTPRMGGVLAPPAVDVEAIEHLEFDASFCTLNVDGRFCGAEPVTHRVVIPGEHPCASADRACAAHALLIRVHQLRARCNMCGHRGILTAVPL